MIPHASLSVLSWLFVSVARLYWHVSDIMRSHISHLSTLKCQPSCSCAKMLSLWASTLKTIFPSSFRRLLLSASSARSEFFSLGSRLPPVSKGFSWLQERSCRTYSENPLGPGADATCFTVFSTPLHVWVGWVLCPCGADVCEWGACHPGWWLVHAYGHQSKLSSGAPEAPTLLAVKKANPERVVVEVGSCAFFPLLLFPEVFCSVKLRQTLLLFSLQCVKPYPFCLCSLLPVLSKWNKHSTPQPTWN